MTAVLPSSISSHEFKLVAGMARHRLNRRNPIAIALRSKRGIPRIAGGELRVERSAINDGWVARLGFERCWR